MVFIDNKKYACETCIKGHRSSSCNHQDRLLIPVKSKGRPVTQCEHCRQLRKTKQVHVKCECNNKERGPPFSTTPAPGIAAAVVTGVNSSAEKRNLDEEKTNEILDPSTMMTGSATAKTTSSTTQGSGLAGLTVSVMAKPGVTSLVPPPAVVPSITRSVSDSDAQTADQGHEPGCACACSTSAVCTCLETTKIERDATRKPRRPSSTASDPYLHLLPLSIRPTPRRSSPPIPPPAQLKLRSIAPKFASVDPLTSSPEHQPVVPSPSAGSDPGHAHGRHPHSHHRGAFSPYGRALEQHEMEQPLPAHPYGLREGPVSWDEVQWMEYHEKRRRLASGSSMLEDILSPSLTRDSASLPSESQQQYYSEEDVPASSNAGTSKLNHAVASTSTAPPSAWPYAMAQPQQAFEYDYDTHSGSAGVSGDVSPNLNSAASAFGTALSEFGAGSVGIMDEAAAILQQQQQQQEAIGISAAANGPQLSLDQLTDDETMRQIDEWLRSIGSSDLPAPQTGFGGPNEFPSDFDFSSASHLTVQPPSVGADGNYDFMQLSQLEEAVVPPEDSAGSGVTSMDFEGTPMPTEAFLSSFSSAGYPPQRAASDPGMGAMSMETTMDSVLAMDDLFTSAFATQLQEQNQADWLAGMGFASPDAAGQGSGASVDSIAGSGNAMTTGLAVSVSVSSSRRPTPPEQISPGLGQGQGPTDGFLFPPLSLALSSLGPTPPGSTIASSSASASASGPSLSASPASLSRASSSASGSSRGNGAPATMGLHRRMGSLGTGHP